MRFSLGRIERAVVLILIQESSSQINKLKGNLTKHKKEEVAFLSLSNRPSNPILNLSPYAKSNQLGTEIYSSKVQRHVIYGDDL